MARTQIDDELVRRLAALLQETNLTEIEYEVGELRLRVARAPSPATVQVAAPVMHAAPVAVLAAAPAAVPVDAVKSPMVGVVYRGAEPGAKPFANEGDEVKEGDTLLLIEAMKTFNPIKAPKSGRVIRFLIGDGTPVEFGEPLLILA
ncbi:MAG TPA: acetyl-CoA carboxylase biotin carboxyl carrier protein subunit [Magnetospirillaceae bacterium]|jgi:acetyl-CoA carboxylase biotin carboxyl carrier protein